MKMFTVNDQEFTARQYIDAKYAALASIGYSIPVSLKIYGVECTEEEFIKVCNELDEKRVENKLKTHNYVRVLYGTSFSDYHWKWIPKKGK